MPWTSWRPETGGWSSARGGSTRTSRSRCARRTAGGSGPRTTAGAARASIHSRQTRKELGMKQVIVAIVVALAIVGSAQIAAAQSEEGTANFYGDKFQGKKTASGEVFDKDGLTAAHKKLPFGTKVKVTNVENGKSVIVTVNDRMAATNPAVIDVTRRAAEELDFAKAGKAKVK